MGFEVIKETYSGSINEVGLGKDGSVKIGGESALAFHLFEGAMPNPPIVAMEVMDIEPEGWPAALADNYADVIGNPVAWAKKCQDEFGAKVICLTLQSSDPNGANASPEECAATAKAVAAAISIPLIVNGSSNIEKDAEVLKKVAEELSGETVVLGPVQEDNFKSIAAAAMGFNHLVSGQTPIDVNMAKQLNILMTNLGMPRDKIIIDPSTGALGYGLEYTYSVIERDRLAALTQNDEMMQMPIICNVGKEAWKTKEAKVGIEEEPNWGEAAERGIIWEAMTALSLAIAGADILIMRHPESINIFNQTIIDLLAV